MESEHASHYANDAPMVVDSNPTSRAMCPSDRLIQCQPMIQVNTKGSRTADCIVICEKTQNITPEVFC